MHGHHRSDAAQARVVVSDVCGAMSEINAEAGAVVPLHAPLEHWVDALRSQLQCDTAPPRYAHGWREAAQEYERSTGLSFQNEATCNEGDRHGHDQHHAISPYRPIPSLPTSSHRMAPPRPYWMT